MSDLTFADLSRLNLERCEKAFHKLNEWTLTDWACAAAGEMGEACNKIKKHRRGERVYAEDIGHELADTVIYIDLLAQRLGLDLGAMVREKFNIVSDRVGSDVKL